MLIDWFTVGAQALNFVILAWLMKRFLYKPILDAIDAREKRIATELAAAGRKKAEAQHERDEFQEKNDALEQQRAALLQKAKADADAERGTLMDAARQAADALAARRQESLAVEAKDLVQALRRRAQDEVFAIARQALEDLAGASLEARACDVFIARLKALEGPRKEALQAALSGAADAVLVRSAFELPQAQRQALHAALADTFGVERDLHFDTDPSLVAGIELVAQGRQFAWTLDDYLASLDRGVSELLKARAPERAATTATTTATTTAHAPAAAPATTPATTPPAPATAATATATAAPAVAAAPPGAARPATGPISVAVPP